MFPRESSDPDLDLDRRPFATGTEPSRNHPEIVVPGPAIIWL
jgi:hypothetical protein